MIFVLSDKDHDDQPWKLAVFICLSLAVIIIILLLLFKFLEGDAKKTIIIILVGALSVVFIIGLILWFTASKIAATVFVIVLYLIIIFGFLVFAYKNQRGNKGLRVPQEL